MKRMFLFGIGLTLAASAWALDLGSGFAIGGGVKTGLFIKNSDYGGNLEGVGVDEQPKLYFASADNKTYRGEAWLNFGYASPLGVGLNVSLWAHGGLTSWSDALRVGDYWLWANFLDDRLKFIGGQGGGAPISSGGWLNADWLSYRGLRAFWIDPSGFSLGFNLPDPDNGDTAEGIKPVTYLSMIIGGARFEKNNFWVSLLFDNNPVYDDSDPAYNPAIRRDPDAAPIAQEGNLAFGLGVNNVFAGKGFIALDGLVSNLGSEDTQSVFGDYHFSPVETTVALKAGYPILEELYAEFKAKYVTKTGDNGDLTGSTVWGKFEMEPYAAYTIKNPNFADFKFDLSVDFTAYVNSYYLAVNTNSAVGEMPQMNAGWFPAVSAAYDYLSSYQLAIKPGMTFLWHGAEMKLGYEGSFSRDHVENMAYVDFRWAF